MTSIFLKKITRDVDLGKRSAMFFFGFPFAVGVDGGVVAVADGHTFVDENGLVDDQFLPELVLACFFLGF